MSALWGISHHGSSANAVAATSSAADAKTRANQAQERSIALEDRLDKLTLITMAVWELLREKAKLTEADLLEKVQELDLRDGVPDGKVTRGISQCPKCGRNMSPRHQRCMYCGSEKLIASVFDSLG